MKGIVSAGRYITTRHGWQVIDVRSEGEFEDGHIPGAVNLPLFSNEERAIVGTLYKQTSPEAAMQQGLAFAGKKMDSLASQAAAIASETGRKLLVHCWRGGKRSQAVEWLLDFTGLEVYRLEGGYKNYRTQLQNFFQQNDLSFHVIGGYTGAGKTELLHALEANGEQVIDLEGMAHHKGSAFGAIGEPLQPKSEQFENELFFKCLQFDPKKPVWIENESKNIGRIYLPEGFWRKMRNSPLFDVEVSRERRLQRVVDYYSKPEDIESLKLAFEKIQKRLGGAEYKNAIAFLEQGDLMHAASIALHYYDKSYLFQLGQWPENLVRKLLDCDNVEEAARKLIAAYKKD